jgi:ribosome-binding factor A
MQSESIRQRKLSDQIKKYISNIVDRKIKDPKKGFITITRSKISRDLKIASIYFSTLGDEEQRIESLKALERAKNFIRRELANLLDIRYVPELRFFYDDSLNYAEHIEKILQSIKKEQNLDNTSPSDPDEDINS